MFNLMKSNKMNKKNNKNKNLKVVLNLIYFLK